MPLPFLKMNGAGNDFVVFDAREHPLAFTLKQLRRIAARGNPATKGCDQVIVMEPAADIRMRIYNADGGEVGICGNATRCVAWLLMNESGADRVTVETAAGRLACERAGDRLVTVDMGPPYFAHEEIPASAGISLDPLPIDYNGLNHGMGLGMGNPHAVFFVEDVEKTDLAKWGPKIENRTDIFPKRTNVGVAQMISRRHIRLRVWERGAGLTAACGTAACAALVAAVRRGLSERKARVDMPGGMLAIEWRSDNHVWMTGPVELEFKGTLDL